MSIELFSTGHPADLPFENVEAGDIEFLGEFSDIRIAADYAAGCGLGWYLWSLPDRGRYLGVILIGPGPIAIVKSF